MIKLIALLRRIKKFLVWFDVLFSTPNDSSERDYLKAELMEIIKELREIRIMVKARMDDVKPVKEV